MVNPIKILFYAELSDDYDHLDKLCYKTTETNYGMTTTITKSVELSLKHYYDCYDKLNSLLSSIYKYYKPACDDGFDVDVDDELDAVASGIDNIIYFYFNDEMQIYENRKRIEQIKN